MLILQTFLLLVLALIAWQDFKFRAVYWWLFPLLFALIVMLKMQDSTWSLITNNLLANSLFLGAQLLCLSLYFSIKERRWVNLFKTYFGLGDLLFLCCLTIYFSLLNYILFYVATLFLIILITVCTQWMVKKADPKIPLAGWQAILLFGLLLLEQTPYKIDLISTFGLTNYLT